ncbi:MAG: substrate-binding domain-containing protein, partial [Euryarchaeota archaeon]|nr:substrate-binding domain-containing protein [Euryarchaeota archaeon]
MKQIYVKTILFFILISLSIGCVEQRHSENETGSTSVAQVLRLSTTTSTCDSGLLDVLNKNFEEVNNVNVLTVCEGTGKAISTGELGASDVVLVHASGAELSAVANGSFINRTYVMFNYFVIIGPESDPAGIKNAKNAS